MNFLKKFFFLQRFIQYLASRNTLFNLNNFLDKGALQGKSHKHRFDSPEALIIMMVILHSLICF